MRVTIKEAAHRLGVAESTVRRRIRNGELAAIQADTPQGYTWMVECPDAEPTLNQSDMRQISAGELRRLEDMVELLERQIEYHQKQVEGYERQLQVKDQQIGELHVLLQQAQAALPAPKESKGWWKRLWRR